MFENPILIASNVCFVDPMSAIASGFPCNLIHSHILVMISMEACHTWEKPGSTNHRSAHPNGFLPTWMVLSATQLLNKPISWSKNSSHSPASFHGKISIKMGKTSLFRGGLTSGDIQLGSDGATADPLRRCDRCDGAWSLAGGVQHGRTLDLHEFPPKFCFRLDLFSKWGAHGNPHWEISYDHYDHGMWLHHITSVSGRCRRWTQTYGIRFANSCGEGARATATAFFFLKGAQKSMDPVPNHDFYHLVI